jgi:hypothetical protein
MNLQSRVRTHAVLVIGLYELLGNPTIYLIEPPRPSTIDVIVLNKIYLKQNFCKDMQI